MLCNALSIYFYFAFLIPKIFVFGPMGLNLYCFRYCLILCLLQNTRFSLPFWIGTRLKPLTKSAGTLKKPFSSLNIMSVTTHSFSFINTSNHAAAGSITLSRLFPSFFISSTLNIFLRSRRIINLSSTLPRP